jgi:YVTN family beta-propeller protein
MKNAARLLGLTMVFCAVPLTAQDHTIVALSHSDFTAYEIDPESGEIVGRFVAEDQPHESVISPDGRTVFVAIPLTPYVAILDGETFEQIGRIDSEFFHRAPEEIEMGGETRINTSALPHGVALNRDGSKLYVGVEWADVPGLVVVDVASREVTGKIDLVLEGGHFIAVDPRTDKLYSPHRGDDRVIVLDTRTDEIVKIIPVQGGPVGVDFREGEAWIHSDGDGSVTVIDTYADEVVAVIQTEGRGAGRMAVSPDGRFAASTHRETEDVAIIDTQSRAVIATVDVGAGPGFPLFSPASDRLYVMNSGEGDVAVIDLASMEVVARHAVGVNPFGGSIRRLPE